jgi:hypothetical protein
MLLLERLLRLQQIFNQIGSFSSNLTMTGKEVHEVGTNDGWHGVIKSGGRFEPEKDRYHMYIGRS